jgi:phage N-6-adenine-methyltransferase
MRRLTMSLVAFRAQNHPQQRIRDEVDDRRTPLDFFAALHAERRFTLDVAASDENALLPVYWTREANALIRSWSGYRVWCNPPYSSIAAWAEKAWSEMVDGSCAHVTMLLPANRCEQPWWQQFIEPFRDGPRIEDVRLTTQFLAGRMRFGRPDGVIWKTTEAKGSRPPFGCVLATWERVS